MEVPIPLEVIEVKDLSKGKVDGGVGLEDASGNISNESDLRIELFKAGFKEETMASLPENAVVEDDSFSSLSRSSSRDA